ncbi:protein WALLS ARE THIN 1-like [Aristolochia californica]|uniref:protein WALLS ARE THIN 1-like n=1 Tax=Aristolochia californica TaxID=171875 RepID=UPI0035D770ED
MTVVLAMIFLQISYAAMYLMTRMALNKGMSHYIYVAYRQIIATFLLSPFAYFAERNQRPPLRKKTLGQIFMLGLLGITLNQNFYNAGLSYTTTTFASTIVNLIPAITFVMAVCVRLETVDLRTRRGMAKVLGTAFCVGGAIFMTLIKGPALTSIKLHEVPRNVVLFVDYFKSTDFKATNWILGAFFVFASALSWSSWMTFQVFVTKDYPCRLSLTALICNMAALQSIIIALLFEKPSAWKVKWDIQLLTCLYSGMVPSAIGYFIQVWGVKEKGPVFTAAFSPLTTVLVAILEPLFLHVNLHLGSLLGMVMVIGGLYSVLWGKSMDEKARERSSGQVRDQLEAEEAGITEALLAKDVAKQ